MTKSPPYTTANLASNQNLGFVKIKCHGNKHPVGLSLLKIEKCGSNCMLDKVSTKQHVH
jgi:hypothetical protein